MKKFFQSVWSVIKKIASKIWPYILIFIGIIAVLEWVKYLLFGGSKPSASQKTIAKAKAAMNQSKQVVEESNKVTAQVDQNVAQITKDHQEILDTEAKRDEAAKSLLPNLPK